MSVAATEPATPVQQQSCSWVENLENTNPSRVTNEYPSIINWKDPKQWKNIPSPVKNSISVEGVQVPLSCQTIQMTDERPLDVQFDDRLTIVTLDLLEINIMYTLEMSVAAT